MENFFSNNIRLLRKKKDMSQGTLAGKLKTTRSSVNNYENGVLPPVNVILLISEYFGISIDTLLLVDMTKLTQAQVMQVERYDNYLRGTYLRILASNSDSANRENINLETYS
jgi:transcriptional regulator with XRE-family HTH domain